MNAHNSTNFSKNAEVIAQICELKWPTATEADMVAVAWAYYYFSIQFRENLCLAREQFASDEALNRLFAEECETSNLSPYPGIALPDEKMNHDEFMRRVLQTFKISETLQAHYERCGQTYLTKVRNVDPCVRAMSIASFEDGGLEALFRALLQSPDYDNVLIKAFRFFLSEHIRFDSDPNSGHGSLSRHLALDDRVAELWLLFRDLVIETNPAFAAAGRQRLFSDLVMA